MRNHYHVTEFFMMRHGESQANAQNVVAGNLDSPLTKEGRQQCINTIKSYKKLERNPDYIVHSHLSRAKDTASIVNNHLNVRMYENTKLGEHNFGEWQGIHSWKEAKKWITEGKNPPHGETQQQFYTRAMQGVTEATSHLPEKLCLIVSHGGIFEAFAQRHNIELPYIENCAIYKFSLQSHNWIVEKISD